MSLFCHSFFVHVPDFVSLLENFSDEKKDILHKKSDKIALKLILQTITQLNYKDSLYKATKEILLSFGNSILEKNENTCREFFDPVEKKIIRNPVVINDFLYDRESYTKYIESKPFKGENQIPENFGNIVPPQNEVEIQRLKKVIFWFVRSQFEELSQYFRLAVRFMSVSRKFQKTPPQTRNFENLTKTILERTEDYYPNHFSYQCLKEKILDWFYKKEYPRRVFQFHYTMAVAFFKRKKYRESLNRLEILIRHGNKFLWGKKQKRIDALVLKVKCLMFINVNVGEGETKINYEQVKQVMDCLNEDGQVERELEIAELTASHLKNEDLFRFIITNSKNDIIRSRTHVELANILLEHHGSFREVLKHLESAIQKNPNNQEAINILKRWEMPQSDEEISEYINRIDQFPPQEKEERLLKVLEGSPQNWEVITTLCSYYAEIGKYGNILKVCGQNDMSQNQILTFRYLVDVIQSFKDANKTMRSLNRTLK